MFSLVAAPANRRPIENYRSLPRGCMVGYSAVGMTQRLLNDLDVLASRLQVAVISIRRTSVQQFSQPAGSPGWVVKFDSKTGKKIGHLDVSEVRGLHSVEQMPSGEPLTTLDNQVLWFKAK